MLDSADLPSSTDTEVGALVARIRAGKVQKKLSLNRGKKMFDINV